MFRTRLYLWKYTCWICFNTIHPLKNSSKVLSAFNQTASTSWINPTHLIIHFFGLFFLSPLIILISLCFHKAFCNPKLDLKRMFLLMYCATFSPNHILPLLLSFLSISLILYLAFLFLLLLTTFTSLFFFLLCCTYTFLCSFCCGWTLCFHVIFSFPKLFSPLRNDTLFQSYVIPTNSSCSFVVQEYLLTFKMS